MYGSAKTKVWVGGMDQVWNRKYERGPIRVDSILSIYASMASQKLAGEKPVSDLELQSQTISGRMGDLALRRRPNENLCSLAWTAQSAPNSREIAPKTPRMGPQSFRKLPMPGQSGHAWGLGHCPWMPIYTYTYSHPLHPGERAESEI